MIEGLIIKKVVLHKDEEGFFSELVKFGEDAFHSIKQVSYSETKPGVIKGFHLHKKYWEMICVVRGELKVGLYDGREHSKTKGEKEVFFAGKKNILVIAVPPGVAHGYKVLGKKPAGVVYCAGKEYNPKNPGIEEISPDDPKINFDWDKKE